MTTVRIPPILDGAGDLVPATVSVRLVLADGRTGAIGFVLLDGLTEYSARELVAAGVELPLAAQSEIAMPGGVATYYRIERRTAGAVVVDLVQVPESGATVELSTLIGGASVPSEDILAGRLLTLGERAGFDAATTPPTADNPVITLTDLMAILTAWGGGGGGGAGIWGAAAWGAFTWGT